MGHKRPARYSRAAPSDDEGDVFTRPVEVIGTAAGGTRRPAASLRRRLPGDALCCLPTADDGRSDQSPSSPRRPSSRPDCRFSTACEPKAPPPPCPDAFGAPPPRGLDVQTASSTSDRKMAERDHDRTNGRPSLLRPPRAGTDEQFSMCDKKIDDSVEKLDPIRAGTDKKSATAVHESTSPSLSGGHSSSYCSSISRLGSNFQI